MKFLLYLPFFIAFQLLGEWLKSELSLPIPAATLGMFMLLLFLFLIPENKNLTDSAQRLILHLPLFFIPAGVGIMSYTEILKHDSLALSVAVVGSTIVSFILAAWVTQKLVSKELASESESGSSTTQKEVRLK